VQLTLDLQVEIKHVCQDAKFVQLMGEDIPRLLHEENQPRVEYEMPVITDTVSQLKGDPTFCGP